jgi:hypothetical protein
MNAKNETELIEQAARLASAMNDISHDGLSLLSSLNMAIAGEGLSEPLGVAVADGLDRVAAAIENGLGKIAEAISELKGN